VGRRFVFGYLLDLVVHTADDLCWSRYRGRLHSWEYPVLVEELYHRPRSQRRRLPKDQWTR